MATNRSGGWRQSFEALRHRDFAIFWTGAVVSNIGSWMQNAAVPFVIYELTKSTALVGVASFLGFAPTVFLGPWAGSMADRYSRRTILIVCQGILMVLALALFVVWASGVRSIAPLIVLIALSGMVTGFNIPAWNSFIPDIVPRESLVSAVLLNSTQFNASRAVGPALAGVVLAAFGPGVAFLVNAVSFAAVLVALAVVTPRPFRRSASTDGALTQFVQSVRYVRARPVMVWCVVGVFIVGALGMPLMSLMPAFATDVFLVDAGAYGLLLGALGFGAVIGTPFFGHLSATVRASRLVMWGMVGYGASLVAFANAPGFGVALAMALLCGVGYLVAVTTFNSTLQLLVEDVMRGRVMALHIMALTVSLPLGSLIQGAIAEEVPVQDVTTGAGVLMIGLALLMAGVGVLRHFDEPSASINVEIEAEALEESAEAMPI